MASVFGHVMASTALGLAFFPKTSTPKVLALAGLCACAPDLDILAFNFGIPYGSVWGHRGASHSVAFALALGCGVAWAFFRSEKNWWKIGLLLFLATLSHPLLDACTTGGRGVALFFPLDNQRVFFPWRVILVSPISPGDFFGEWGTRVLASEFRWIGMPALSLVLGSWFARRVVFLNKKKILVLLALSVLALPAFSQLDTIHWLPPMHARSEWGPQYLFLSTPETTPFEVEIRRSDGQKITSVTISNTQPFKINWSSTNDSHILVPESELHKPIPDRGLVMVGEKKFYAYLRVHSNSQFQAGDLTCKGRAALGKTFRIGHLIQEKDETGGRANFIGVLATEDSTEIELSGYDPATDFRINGNDQQQAQPVKIQLKKGESVVFSQYLGLSSAVQPPLGLMGSLLTSNRPVAVNVGSWNGSPVVFRSNDIGIDQIVPFEEVGDEYILCRAKGSEVLEHPIVIAHRDGTQVFLNGSPTPAATLDGGEYFIVPTSNYSAAGNIYIRSSEPAYVYQMIGGIDVGDDQFRTAGLIFVPPLSCGIPNAVDNIFEPNRIGSMSFEGGLMIVAMRDSAVTVRLDGSPVSLGAAASVPGNPDFVTYRSLNLFSQNTNPQTLSVVAEGAVQVAMFGRNNPASFAAFFSGFTKVNRPTIQVSLVGDGVCPDTLIARGRFDGVQWFYEDSVLQYGPDTMFIAYAPGRYIATGYLGVCRRNDFAADTAVAIFMSPAFPFAFEEPSCFGYSDGVISFGQPSGGIAPYQFSIDHGQNFSKNSLFSSVAAGTYKLVARDSTGCYNRPLEIEIGQPEGFEAEILVLDIPDPLKPGGEIRLDARATRQIGSVIWQPPNEDSCVGCTRYSARPEESGWVTVEVFDTAGCKAVDSLWVEVYPNVFVPNVFHPASNVGNERFTFFSREPLTVKRLQIFDRWGEVVFENKNFQTNDPAVGWNGKFRGKEMPPGVYVWLAEVETVPGLVEVLRGDLTLVR